MTNSVSISVYEFTVVKEDVAYRKSVLPTMLSVLKELREKSEFIQSESEKESENTEGHKEEANPIAEDDFFIEEWIVCSIQLIPIWKWRLNRVKAVSIQFNYSYKLSIPI